MNDILDVRCAFKGIIAVGHHFANAIWCWPNIIRLRYSSWCNVARNISGIRRRFYPLSDFIWRTCLRHAQVSKVNYVTKLPDVIAELAPILCAVRCLRLTFLLELRGDLFRVSLSTGQSKRLVPTWDNGLQSQGLEVVSATLVWIIWIPSRAGRSNYED